MRLVLLLVAVSASGCVLHGRIHVFPRCADGLPPLILRHAACPPDGICGYSCLPDRWEREKEKVQP